MLRPVVVLTLTVALLSGCFGKDASRADMEQQATQAIENFSQDVLPGGRLAAVEVPRASYITVESEVGGFPVLAKPNVQARVDLGPSGEVLVSAQILSMQFTGYCDPTHIVTVTKNTQDYGIYEGSLESRNAIGRCTGPGSEQLLLEKFEFELIDPAILTGQLQLDNMTAVGFSDAGKGKVSAEYRIDAPDGSTTLFIKVHKDKVVQIVADNVDSHLVMDMVYGERAPVQKPAADKRLVSPVTGATTRDDDGWHWRGVTREGGPMADYSLSVYEKGTTVACGGTGAEPIVTFDLGGPALQEASGWRLVIYADQDGLLGMGDELTVTPPNTIVQDFDHVVVIHDDLAGAPARLECQTPGFSAGAGALGLLAALGVAMRRR